MIQDAHVARHDFVLQDGAGGYVNTIAVISYNNHGALKRKRLIRERKMLGNNFV